MENPINEIQLVKGKRGRPRKDADIQPKLWESKEHVSLYNKLYYRSNTMLANIENNRQYKQ